MKDKFTIFSPPAGRNEGV
jgi:hypothetical protein